LAGEYAHYALVSKPGVLPGGVALGWFASWALELPMSMAVWLVLLFPDGRLPSSRWRPVAWLLVLSAVPSSLVYALTPGALVIGERRA
jgi:hypothetical protein